MNSASMLCSSATRLSRTASSSTRCCRVDAEELLSQEHQGSGRQALGGRQPQEGAVGAPHVREHHPIPVGVKTDDILPAMRANDPDAAENLWKRYFDKLLSLVRRNLRAYADDPLVCRLIIAEARVLDGYYESSIAELSRSRCLLDAARLASRSSHR